jgi:hypothetical protein
LAIKGKKKTRGGRPGTNAPRPVVVVPKRPILARPITRWGILGLVVLAIAATLLIAWNKEQDKKVKERQGIAIDEASNKMDLAVQGVSTPAAGSGSTVLSGFTPQVEAVRAGTAKPADVTKLEKDAKAVPKALDNAIAALGAFEIPKDLLNTKYTAEVLDAKTLEIEALNVYKVGAELVRDALALEGKTQKTLLDRASEQFSIGARLFDDGHQKIVNIRVELGTFTGADFNPLAPQTP